MSDQVNPDKHLFSISHLISGQSRIYWKRRKWHHPKFSLIFPMKQISQVLLFSTGLKRVTHTNPKSLTRIKACWIPNLHLNGFCYSNLLIYLCRQFPYILGMNMLAAALIINICSGDTSHKALFEYTNLCFLFKTLRSK